jgi:hypothetical protein
MTHRSRYNINRKRRIERQYRKMAAARAAKAAKRLAGDPPEPKMQRWNRYTITVTDRLTGETGSFELRSLRDAVKRLGMVVRYL